jgi:hypothetical protein
MSRSRAPVQVISYPAGGGGAEEEERHERERARATRHLYGEHVAAVVEADKPAVPTHATEPIRPTKPIDQAEPADISRDVLMRAERASRQAIDATNAALDRARELASQRSAAREEQEFEAIALLAALLLED